MANKILLSQATTTALGSGVSFSGSENVRIIQFNPKITDGFSGSVLIEQSYSTSPGNTDYATLATVDFSVHKSDLILEIISNAPTIRASVSTYTSGGIAIYGGSADRNTISGSQGSSTGPTAVVSSSHKVAGSGPTFKINSVVVPSITSDDVVYSSKFSLTVTDLFDGTNGAIGKQDKIGTGAITASEADVNILTGVATYGLTLADMQRVADTNTTTTQANYSSTLTSNIQTQLDAITAAQSTGSIAAMATTGAIIDGFFTTTPTVTITNLNNLSGLTATAADLNYLLGTAGTFTAADLVKLGTVTATAVEINKLSGFTGTSTDLNAISGITSSIADLNTIVGLNATGVSTTQLSFLSGLTQNVQAYIAAQPTLTGLTATANDINLLTGAFTGTGSFSGAITATEMSYLDGVTSAIQTQIDAKRIIGVDIGISEISGASITTTELNYASGVTSNIQSQFDAISGGNYITTTGGGTMNVPLFMSDGTAVAPGMGFAGATSTGAYLEGAGIGFAVAGVRMGSLDATNLVIGDGATAGNPTIKGTSQSVLNPAYTFTGDTDTGMFWIGADSVGISAAGTVMASFDSTANAITLGGAATENNDVNITGLFGGERELGSADILAGAGTGTVGQTALYTVPTGRTAVITKVLVILTNVVAFTDATLLRMNMGFGASFNELVDNVTNTTIFNDGFYTFGTAGQVLPLGVGSNTFPAIAGSSGADYQILTSATVLNADVTALANSTQFDMKLVVFGYEY
jgi:hypothetical protein